MTLVSSLKSSFLLTKFSLLKHWRQQWRPSTSATISNCYDYIELWRPNYLEELSWNLAFINKFNIGYYLFATSRQHWWKCFIHVPDNTDDNGVLVIVTLHLDNSTLNQSLVINFTRTMTIKIWRANSDN